MGNPTSPCPSGLSVTQGQTAKEILPPDHRRVNRIHYYSPRSADRTLLIDLPAGYSAFGNGTEPAMVDVLAAVPKDDVEDDVTEQLDFLRAPFESTLWLIGEDGRRQAGPGVLRDLHENARFAALTSAATTPEPLRPELSPALVEAWAMTSLEHHTGRPKVDRGCEGGVE